MSIASATSGRFARRPASPLPSARAVAAGAAIAACSLLWMASENHYAQCLATQGAAGTAQAQSTLGGSPAVSCKRYVVL